jgi:drug/metabolite transporter (DMT)-like permease
MSDSGLVAIALGVLVIALRGPLIFAPEATTHFYRMLLATHTRVRSVGVVIGALGVALIVTFQEPQGALPWVLAGLGWLLAAGAVFLLTLPSLYKRLADSVFDAVEDGRTVDPALVRGAGVLSVIVGALLIYWGAWIAG